jgi:hypothetical protein
MVKVRGKAIGLPESTCCHTFRATGITAYLENGGTIEKAQAIAAHASPRTTKLYDRTSDVLTLEEIEKIDWDLSQRLPSNSTSVILAHRSKTVKLASGSFTTSLQTIDL